MNVKVGISNRHIHLTNDDYKLLFDEELTKRNDLKQPGEFASNQVVTLVGPKGSLENVRVLGPFRKYTQVEVSKTDSYKLGINPPIKASGDLEDASLITIKTNKGLIERKACIIANRHIHINSKLRNEYDLNNIKEVKIKVNGEKGGILEHVYLKDMPDACLELHLDTDDANAFNLKNDDLVEIIK